MTSNEKALQPEDLTRLFVERANAGDALDQLQDFMNKKTGWLFGHLGYDLKNEIEKLSSKHSNRVVHSKKELLDNLYILAQAGCTFL